MLPSAPVVITIVFGGAGCTKCRVIHITASSSSTNGPYVSAASRQETCEILKRGISGFRTLAAREVGSPTRARTWDLRINSPSLYQLSYRGSDGKGGILSKPPARVARFPP